jgi:ABC-2 type transport system ATP-binding protein
MKLLTGYLSPTAGVARIGGHDMASDRLAGSRRLGYLPENGPLYPDMTPLSLLSFFADARGLRKSHKQDRLDAVIELCSLEGVVYKPIGKLSRGYRQRVGMAQVLLHEPDVLILDEPTAGLDPNQIHEVRETIRKLGQNKTILLSTHILQEVEAMARRVLFIDEGRLVYDGSIKELTQDGKPLDVHFRQLSSKK